VEHEIAPEVRNHGQQLSSPLVQPADRPSYRAVQQRGPRPTSRVTSTGMAVDGRWANPSSTIARKFPIRILASNCGFSDSIAVFGGGNEYDVET
jgi:hypothetical protein